MSQCKHKNTVKIPNGRRPGEGVWVDDTGETGQMWEIHCTDCGHVQYVDR